MLKPVKFNTIVSIETASSRRSSADDFEDNSNQVETMITTTKIKGIFHTTHDHCTDLDSRIRPDRENRRGLCHECERIPFNDYLPTGFSPPRRSTGSLSNKPTVFCLKLEQVVSHRSWCKFCGLLFKSICRPENDLLKAEHIRKHLHTSEKLKDIRTFKQWVETFSTWEKWTEGEDIWPFGYTRDQKEAAKETTSVAMTLFQSAEDKDLNAGVVDGMYETEDSLSKVLQITAGVAGVTNLADSGRAFAGVQLVTSQMAMFNIGKAKALPCLFVIKAYRLDEAKDGVLSVRVYAHGRAPRAPLKEICHFSLRLEQSHPRAQGEQLWYGRTLKPRIDIPFFEQCLVACQQLHGDACNKFPWSSQADFHEIDRTFPIRLIDVWRMQIVRENFARIIKSAPDPDHRSYVVLSYTWGTSEWTEHKDQEGTRSLYISTTLFLLSVREVLNPMAANTLLTALGRTYYYNMITKTSTYDRPSHTRLTRKNMASLLQPGSLKKSNVYIPKTIQDAIEVCRGMGEQFLWVDSLCIIQDEADPDNSANIARMGRIYGEAIFTIVAGDAPNADAGMKGISTDRVVADQLMDKVLGKIQLFLPIGMQQSFHPWESRAWTFQEKLLSRRMLVIASGYAVWRCRGGIWREDVNALDGNCESASFPWTQLKAVPKLRNNLEKSGLQIGEEDESFRLFRLPAFYQYIKVVEDFSGRGIGEPWKIMDAFEGLQRVLESPEILDSSFRYGIPVRFLDSAILWQPRGIVRRRRNEEDESRDIPRLSPPSWSWAGWESAEAGSKGANINFDTPFKVHADEKGLVMFPTPLGEERLRPLHRSVYGVKEVILPSESTTSHKLTDLGLLNEKSILNQVSRDWESFQQIMHPALPPRGLLLKDLSDRHLVFHTEIASLWLGHECFRVRTRTKLGDTECFRETLQDYDPSQTNINISWSYGVPGLELEMTVARERWIIDASSSKLVGTVKLHSGAKLADSGQCDGVTAMVLSEAQYLGNEKRVDVLGYPLYNIMVIEKRGNGLTERVGLGKIYKSAWKRAGPKLEVVILE